jgi:hypothetical protein
LNLTSPNNPKKSPNNRSRAEVVAEQPEVVAEQPKYTDDIRVNIDKPQLIRRILK